MYTVEVYNKDRVVIESETFNTYEEAKIYAGKYAVEYYTKINNLQFELFDAIENFDPSSLSCDCPEDDA